MTARKRRPKVLALSSGGGHWVQLLRLRPAFDGCEVIYATVRRTYGGDTDGSGFCVIPDCSRTQKLRVLWCGFRVFLLLLRLRPDVVVTTGSAPGYLALRLGRLTGARTIWVDSVANAEELSMSGRMAGGYASLWLTQWPHLAEEGGPHFRGSVL